MRKLTVGLVVFLLLSVVGCIGSTPYFFDSIDNTTQNITLPDAAKIVGFEIPVPVYLPGNNKIQETYVQDKYVRLIISDKNLEKQLVTRTANNQTIQEYEFQCTMKMGITWLRSGGIGLKLPGERPNITPRLGITDAAVIWRNEELKTLWWDWRPNPVEQAIYEITITASSQTSNEELVKVAESMRF